MTDLSKSNGVVVAVVLTLTGMIISVVTGQVQITLEWNNIAGVQRHGSCIPFPKLYNS